MKHKSGNRRALRLFIGAGFCLLIAAFFAFVLAGYRFAAFFFLLLAGALAIYGLAAWLRPEKPRAAKVLGRGMTVTICILAALLIGIEIPIVSAARGDAEPEAEYLLVLGAGVNGRSPSLSLVNRLEAALEYLQRYPKAKCIVSGGMGPGEEITEAACMYTWLTENGVDSGRLLLEDRAENTEENIAFSMALVPEGSKIAIVSSEYHLFRAKLLAERQGVDAFGVPAKTSLPVLKLSGFFREAFGVVYLWIFG